MSKHTDAIRGRLQEAAKSIDALKDERRQRPADNRRALVALWAVLRALADESEVPPTTEPPSPEPPAEPPPA